jgi:hypothetical protein
MKRIILATSAIAALAFIILSPAPADAATCVTIRNTTNVAAYRIDNNAAVYLKYTDYGDNLGYSKPLPRSTWAAFRAAEAKLTAGKPGPKIARACTA